MASTFRTVPLVWKSRGVCDSNTTVMEPLVLAVRIITLDHIVRQLLLADTVLDRFFRIGVDKTGIGLSE